jgi:UDP-N-acetylmuramate: L-alanyl-gamma-D-glutamyl-meso-diaminopimelate ligase
VLVADVYHHKEQLPPEARFSPKTLVEALREHGVGAWFYPTTEEIIAHLCRDAQSTDVLLIMSNGGFDNIHQRLLAALEQVLTQG